MVEASEGNLSVCGWAPHWGAHLSGPSATGKNLDQFPTPAYSWAPGPEFGSPGGPPHQSPGKALSTCNGTPAGAMHLPQTEHLAKGLGAGSPSSFPQRDSLPDLPLCNPRIGHKATLLVPLLLFAILGMRTAFMPSFELCMALCFSVYTAAAGYTFRNVTLT